MPYRDPEKQKAWKAAHKDKVREYSRRYYSMHKWEKAEYQKEKADEIKEWRRAHYARPEKKVLQRKYRMNYYYRHKTKALRMVRDWKKMHPASARASVKKSYIKQRTKKIEQVKQWKDRRRRDEAALITARMIRVLTHHRVTGT